MKRCNPSNGRECGNTKLHEQVIFISTIFIHTVHKGNLQCRIEQKQSQQNKELVSGSQDNTTLSNWGGAVKGECFIAALGRIHGAFYHFDY